MDFINFEITTSIIFVLIVLVGNYSVFNSVKYIARFVARPRALKIRTFILMLLLDIHSAIVLTRMQSPEFLGSINSWSMILINMGIVITIFLVIRNSINQKKNQVDF